jgi:hypothetical protein
MPGTALALFLVGILRESRVSPEPAASAVAATADAVRPGDARRDAAPRLLLHRLMDIAFAISRDGRGFHLVT